MHIALISSIEQGRHLERSPAIPILLAEPYFDALKQCETLVLQCLALKWDEIDYRYLVSALTTFQGFIGLAQMLEIAQATTECPECQAVFVTPGYELLIDPADLSHGTKLFQGHQSGSLKVWRVCATDWHKMVDWLRKHALSPWRAIQTCDLCLADLKERVR